MNPLFIETYHSLPYPLKCAAATIWGRHLKSRRYGGETEEKVRQALERETWTPEKWRQWTSERLAAMLHAAATQVPYYENYWRERRQKGDRSSWEDLRNWPILEKETLRRSARAFVVRGASPRRLVQDSTSGSTGTPLDIWISLETLRAWYALFEARWRRWHGVNLESRWAILGGQRVASARRTKPPFWVWNGAFHQLYLSSYHISAETAGAYFDALHQHKVEYIYAYPSALQALCQAAGENAKGPRLKVVLTNAEPLYEEQRKIIARVFDCPVRETYGMSERVAAAGECAAGTLHLWPEAGILEMEGGPGRSSDLICTGLMNEQMPLIRYRVGDRGVPAEAGTVCSCGRTLPAIGRIEGRSDDFIVTPEGRVIGRLDPVFKAGFPIREAQIVQDDSLKILLRIVPAGGYDAAAQERLVKAFKDYVGNVTVAVEILEKIPRGANGKFRAVVRCPAPLSGAGA
ncbi:MAG TPA: AMP-binding protein [Verrucomicrobiae bacterium]|nr:AMP-binding protein [Verrucomicrobiae bacterium]